MENIITVGRRKTAVARVILKSGSGNIVVNKKPLKEYFKIDTLCQNVLQPLKITSSLSNYNFDIDVCLLTNVEHWLEVEVLMSMKNFDYNKDKLQ